VLSWPLPQDPDDIRYRGFDWSPWLGGERTSISTSTFIVAGTDVVLDDEAIDGGITRFRIKGGTAGQVAKITNRVVFDNGESKDQTAQLRIRAA
jgi:hypothetical protein